MKYSKRITDLQSIYQLTPEEVFFCMLVAAGATRAEAFATIFRPSSTKQDAAAKGASTLAHDKPGVNKLIKSFEDNYLTHPSYINDEEGKEEKRKKGTKKVKQYRDKDSILTALEEELTTLRGKERTEVLLKIADLQRMKQDENKEEEEKVHYYLPLKCALCPLFIASKSKKDKRKTE